MSDERAAQNTDRELWRLVPESYYSPSIHVTEQNGIGINVGGHVIVMPVDQWHALGVAAMRASHQPSARLADAEFLLREMYDAGDVEYDDWRNWKARVGCWLHRATDQTPAGPTK